MGQRKPIGRRLAPEDRERQILDEAVRFFAEAGFDGNTRDLAKRLGITQPLLFRYFATKDELIERAYQEVFPQKWYREWDALLDDAKRPLRERLLAFYTDYATKFLTYENIRLFLFARLSENPLFKPYMRDSRDRISQRLVQKVVRALYIENGIPQPANGQFSERDLEIVWGFQESVMYYGIRCVVHGMPPAADIEALLALKVDTFLEGARAMIARKRPAQPRRIVRASSAKAPSTTRAPLRPGSTRS